MKKPDEHAEAVLNSIVNGFYKTDEWGVYETEEVLKSKYGDNGNYTMLRQSLNQLKGNKYIERFEEGETVAYRSNELGKNIINKRHHSISNSFNNNNQSNIANHSPNTTQSIEQITNNAKIQQKLIDFERAVKENNKDKIKMIFLDLMATSAPVLMKYLEMHLLNNY